MQHKVLTYYRQDLIDTMAREANMHPAYYGLQKLIELSCGTPRTILRLLKTAFKNQYFNTNKYPFEKEQKLSINSQQVGIEDTYNWFLKKIAFLQLVNQGRLMRLIVWETIFVIYVF